MNTDADVIISALQKERDALHNQIMQIDRIIKRVKSLEYSPDGDISQPKEISQQSTPIPATQPAKSLPRKSDIKVLILRAFDILGKASTLAEIQAEFNQINGSNYNIKEVVRAMKNAGFIKIIRQKNSTRGFLWVKADWIINGQIADNYKTDGFDVLYKPENLVYE
jgi:hypothetical protein